MLRDSLRRLARARGVLPCLLLLALLGAVQRAVFMPPWGLMDEAQHVHYAHSLAERGVAPHAGRDLLSQELVDSQFATRRWELFRWETPTQRAPEQLGLAGRSYEGYHPPLYYALCATLHRVWGGDLLAELYGLRLVSVALSLLTLLVALLAAREAFPTRPELVVLGVALLAALPERMHAVARVNNDVLLELCGALATWACVRICVRGASWGASAALALAFCAGMWTKTSMVALAPLPVVAFALRRGERGVGLKALSVALVVAAGVWPLVARNLERYGDWSGFAGFLAAAGEFWGERELSASGVARALYDSLTRPWVIWQRGMHEMRNPAVVAISAALGVAALIAALGAAREARAALADLRSSLADSRSAHAATRRSRRVCLALFAAAATAVAALVYAVQVGKIPLINARFLAPFSVAIALALARGLSLTRVGRILSAPLVLALFALTPLLLFGSELQYFYWPRDPAAVGLDLSAKLRAYAANIAADRPGFAVALQLVTPPLYVGVLAWLGYAWLRARRSARSGAG